MLALFEEEKASLSHPLSHHYPCCWILDAIFKMLFPHLCGEGQPKILDFGSFVLIL